MMSSSDELPFMKRAELRMHLMMCKHCSRYAKHLHMLKDGFKKLLGKKTRVDRAEVVELERNVLDRLRRKKS